MDIKLMKEFEDLVTVKVGDILENEMGETCKVVEVSGREYKVEGSCFFAHANVITDSDMDLTAERYWKKI